ncbi:MAG: hypothetical protein Q7J65_01910 [Candidatus Marinimicrobia bacterium]|nr:hypothetical protein [Candidatus Neomarinimicrobiota bacterium]
MDKLVEKIVALGIPGLVLLIAISATGYTGAAALTTALAALGGPFGMLGGIALLGLLVLISNGIAKYGFERIYRAVLGKLKEDGLTEEEIIKKINNYPISKGMKLKLINVIEEHR